MQTFFSGSFYSDPDLPVVFTLTPNSLRIASVDESEVCTISLKSLRFPVVAVDYSKEVSLKISVDVGIESDSPRNIRANNVGYIESIVKNAIKSHISESLRIHDYYYMPLEALETALKDCLTSALEQENRTLERFFCEGRDAPPISSGVQEVSQSISHILGAEKDSKNEVMINFRANMQIANLQYYLRENNPDLQSWFSDQIGNIVRQTLFKKDISELFAFGETLESEIEKELESKATSIGFELTALISEPQFEGMELTKPFDLQVEQEFQTNEDGGNVRLSIDVTARVDKENLRAVMDTSKTVDDVKQTLRQAILDAAQHYLLTVSPGDYYMHYGFTSDGQPGVEQLLRKNIEERLNNSYLTDVIRVITKKLDDGITQKVTELISQDYWPIKLKFETADFEGKLKLKGQFRVDNVSGWHLFQKQSPTLERIQDRLQIELGNILSNHSSNEMVNRSIQGQKELLDYCQLIMQRAAQQTFGLDVTLHTVTIGITGLERQKIELTEQLAQVKFEGQRQSLENLRNRIETSKASAHKSDQISLEILEKQYDRLVEMSDDPEISEKERERLEEDIRNEQNKHTTQGQSIEDIERQLNDEKASIRKREGGGLKDGIRKLHTTQPDNLLPNDEFEELDELEDCGAKKKQDEDS